MTLEAESLFQRLLAASPFSEREMVVLIATAPYRYKDHFIEKRNGRGKRLISQPTAELKFLQRFLVKQELANLPLHGAAVAYRSGMSIKDHAQIHAGARYLLKLDFRDFFPSLKSEAIRYRLKRDADYSDREQWILCQLLCRGVRDRHDLRLSIGAPSSPFVSNYLMWEFDTRVTEICRGYEAKFTRYADDLAISASQPRVLDDIEKAIRSLLRNELEYLGLLLNEEKTVNVSKKHRRTLTGLVLSNDGKASIGREEKRRLRAALDALCKGRLAPDEVGRLRGQLAFAYSIDPDFVLGLCARNGFERVCDISVPQAGK